MPAPTVATYSVLALAAAQTSFRDLLDAGGGAGSIKIRDAADVLLAVVPLSLPSGSVNGATGQLTLTAGGRDESADASGTASYGEFCDGDGAVHLSLPAQAGSGVVVGKLVINSLTIAAGDQVEVLAATVG